MQWCSFLSSGIDQLPAVSASVYSQRFTEYWARAEGIKSAIMAAPARMIDLRSIFIVVRSLLSRDGVSLGPACVVCHFWTYYRPAPVTFAPAPNPRRRRLQKKVKKVTGASTGGTSGGSAVGLAWSGCAMADAASPGDAVHADGTGGVAGGDAAMIAADVFYVICKF